MFAKKKRSSTTLTASTAYVTYAINHIMAFVTNGHSRWPHQMVIRFNEIDDIDDIEQVEGNGFLHSGIHVWVDVGDRIRMEFLLTSTLCVTPLIVGYGRLNLFASRPIACPASTSSAPIIKAISVRSVAQTKGAYLLSKEVCSHRTYAVCRPLNQLFQ